MGLFFSKDENQTGGFQTENVPESEPLVSFNESPRISLLDEKYLIPRIKMTPPLIENPDPSIHTTSAQTQPEEKYFDPEVGPAECSLP